MPRPTKLTPERIERICEAIRKGNHRENAARMAGIGESTLYEWLQKGRRAKSGRYAEFLEAVKKAEAESEAGAVDRVRDAMPHDWRAAMTFLERRYPDRWGRRERHEHTGSGGGPIDIRVTYGEDG